MSLPLPRLDSRTFEELVRGAVRTVPRRAPAWTDHNLHDPGITLVDLFSWLVESDLYRLDRTTPALLRTFLRHVGIEVAPALAARTQLELSGLAVDTALPAGIHLCSADGSIVFEAVDALFVSSAQLIGLVAVHDGEAHDVGTLQAAGETWRPWGPVPEPGDVLEVRFDRPLASAPATVALWAWTGNGAADWRERLRLIAEHASAVDAAAVTCPDGAAGVPDWQAHYGVHTIWEYLGPAGWAPLADVVDETRALSMSGPVRFTAPLDQVADGGAYPIRCRVVRGRFDCPPRLLRLGLNVVQALHGARIDGEEALGVSAGWAGQRLALRQRPPLPGSAAIRVEDGGGSVVWTEAPDWDRVGPFDQVFVLDRERGEVMFGNGRVGAVPAADAQLFTTYAIGGGSAGNLAAGKVERGALDARNESLVPGWAALAATLQVLQPEAAFGGAEAETLRDAQARALARIEQVDRVVTIPDCEDLAARTPGVPVHAARAIAEHHPLLPCVDAAGCLTVVVVPRCPADRPEPSEAMLHAVRRWLLPRQLMAAELFVVAPTFAEVVVEATLVLEANTTAGDRAAQAAEALQAFLHPTRGGPDGNGWPVGRDVYRAEVLEVLQRLPDVAWVETLSIGLAGEKSLRCGDMPVCARDVVVSGAHRVEVIERRELR
jgi:hypothetical protein